MNLHDDTLSSVTNHSEREQGRLGGRKGDVGLVVWFVELILLERHQFMDKIDGEPITGPTP
jgi:hypothetical protein